MSENQIIGTENPSPTISSIIGWFKHQTTKYINNENNVVYKKIWQRSFYDHIVRNTNEYYEIWQYIDENPVKWANDKHYSV